MWLRSRHLQYDHDKNVGSCDAHAIWWIPITQCIHKVSNTLLKCLSLLFDGKRVNSFLAQFLSDCRYGEFPFSEFCLLASATYSDMSIRICRRRLCPSQSACVEELYLWLWSFEGHKFTIESQRSLLPSRGLFDRPDAIHARLYVSEKNEEKNMQ